jgi:hypothetical protein
MIKPCTRKGEKKKKEQFFFSLHLQMLQHTGMLMPFLQQWYSNSLAAPAKNSNTIKNKNKNKKVTLLFIRLHFFT